MNEIFVHNSTSCAKVSLVSDVRLNQSPRTSAVPLLALLFASLAGLVLIVFRVKWTHNWYYFYLPWNLFLAWLPLLFAIAVHRRHLRGERYGLALCALASLWLLFFPNAPYIFTDLIHVAPRFDVEFWVDLSIVLLFALTGFLLGFISLYLMQSIVTERFGRATGWLFALAVTMASGFGVYLGRFLRWNSWDVLVHPLSVSHSIGHLAAHPLANFPSVLFSTLFATFLFIGYLMLYALTHLQTRHHPQQVSA